MLSNWVLAQFEDRRTGVGWLVQIQPNERQSSGIPPTEQTVYGGVGLERSGKNRVQARPKNRLIDDKIPADSFGAAEASV